MVLGDERRWHRYAKGVTFSTVEAPGDLQPAKSVAGKEREKTSVDEVNNEVSVTGERMLEIT